MPCYDPRPSGPTNLDSLSTKEELAAALCCVLTNVGGDMIERMDWRESGVTKRQVRGWWKVHQREDKIRRGE